MMMEKIKNSILYSLEQSFGLTLKSDEVEVVSPPDRDLGDYTSPISFRLAKQLSKSPKEIAEILAENLSKTGEYRKVEAVNGHVNLFLNLSYYQEAVKDILSKGSHYADLDILEGEKIQVEFISANPTGPLTLANGRGGFGGDALARVLEKAGAKVEREYYVNDGGNQVNILGRSVLNIIEKQDTEEELYKGEYLEEWVSANKEVISKNAQNPYKLGLIVASDLLENQIKPSVENMGIKFDNYFSEKDMIERGEVEEAIEKLKKFNHIKEEDGALWMKTTAFGDDKDRVLVKADKEKTYFANDVAYHFDKLYKRNFTKIINFWGADHYGYIGRMMAAISSMGCPGSLKIVLMQMVRLIKDGKEYKMSKRRGTYVTMDDLLVLISGKEKLSGKKEIKDASDVARFFFLMRSFNTHMDFDLDLAKERSDKNPVYYVKYAYARICSILAKSEDLKDIKEANLDLLASPEEIGLIDQLTQLPQLVASIVTFDGYPVHYLTYYAMDTAKKFHYFYDKCRVIDSDNLELTAARLKLVEATGVVLGIVMRDLLGIDAPEKM